MNVDVERGVDDDVCLMAEVQYPHTDGAGGVDVGVSIVVVAEGQFSVVPNGRYVSEILVPRCFNSM